MLINNITDFILCYLDPIKEITVIYVLLVTILHSIRIKSEKVDETALNKTIDENLDKLDITDTHKTEIKDRLQSKLKKIKEDYIKCYSDRTIFPAGKVIFACIFLTYISICSVYCPIEQNESINYFLAPIFLIGTGIIICLGFELMILMYKTNNLQKDIINFNKTIVDTIHEYYNSIIVLKDE